MTSDEIMRRLVAEFFKPARLVCIESHQTQQPKGTKTMSDIYDQHKAAFSHVSAYVVVKDGELVARIAFKFPKDGAGRLYAYVHWLGVPMVRGFATGGGYDKRSAACSVAASRMISPPAVDGEVNAAAFNAFRSELAKDDGATWNDRLRKAGFTVLSAI